MLKSEDLGRELKGHGFNFYTGVPCSFLKAFINYAINDCEYVSAANEGDAVAIASGVCVGGRKSIVLMQNSGFTNAISPLTSLNHTFSVPILCFVSLRGEVGIPDEPQHELMGRITGQMLDLMSIKWDYLSADIKSAGEQIRRAKRFIEGNQTFFFIVRKGTFEDNPVNQRVMLKQDYIKIKSERQGDEQMPSRYEAIRTINELKDKDTILLATTGKTGRELYDIEDSPNNFYMVGSMGCISSFGLGIALTKRDKDIIVIDGDGSLLMRLGSMATNGYYHPSNMLHILLDNGSHDSTGGQATVSSNVEFANIASSCGYPHSFYLHNIDELKSFIKMWKANKKLTFLYLKIAKGSKEKLGRPLIKPHEVKERLMDFLRND